MFYSSLPAETCPHDPQRSCEGAHQSRDRATSWNRSCRGHRVQKIRYRLRLQINRLLFATVLVEVTFALPGLGSLLIDSVNFKDMPVVQGLGMLFAVIIIAVNILVDLAYLLIDPRIRSVRSS